MSSPKLNELFMAKEELAKEHEILKHRFDQLLNRERMAREEIRDLKSQLMKRCFVCLTQVLLLYSLLFFLLLDPLYLLHAAIRVIDL